MLGLEEFIHKVRDEKLGYVHVAAAGAAAGTINEMWKPCGSSSYLAGGAFNNSRGQTLRFLGFEPERFVDRTTAIEIAMASYRQACIDVLQDNVTDRPPIGIGVTASVSTEAWHRGDHRACIAVFSEGRCSFYEQKFAKLEESAWKLLRPVVKDAFRESESETTASLSVLVLAHHLGLSTSTLVETVTEDELRTIFMQKPLFLPNGRRVEASWLDGRRFNALPCTINPLHVGHKGMADEVESNNTLDDRSLGAQLTIYINTVKPRHGKQPPSVATMLQRAAQVAAANFNDCTLRGVLFTELALFTEMAQAFHPKYIICGADSVMRALEPKWYPSNDQAGVKAMLREIELAGSQIAVFGRIMEGKLVSADEVIDQAYAEHGAIIKNVMQRFNGAWDISSTELRAKSAH